jgi:FKBP-type peptidyl-prolyl cis-trans isomerase FkpA
MIFAVVGGAWSGDYNARTMNRHLNLAVCSASVLLLLSGCSMDSFRKQGATRVTGEPETLTYADQLEVDLSRMTRSASGLYYLDRKVGEGIAANSGDRVSVGYVGRLANGFLFDQSGAGDPIEFRLGARQVIDGWEEGIRGMKVGGRRLLVIPPGLAYGAQSPGAGIPPNATLVFDLTLEGVSQ